MIKINDAISLRELSEQTGIPRQRIEAHLGPAPINDRAIKIFDRGVSIEKLKTSEHLRCYLKTMEKQPDKQKIRIEAKKPRTLSQLAYELDLPKSMLTYYSSRGLIVPVATISRIQIFERDEVIKALNLIRKEKQKNGKSLDDIKKIIRKCK